MKMNLLRAAVPFWCRNGGVEKSRTQELKKSRIQGVENSRSQESRVAGWAAAFRPVDRDSIGFPCDEQWIWRQYLFATIGIRLPELL